MCRRLVPFVAAVAVVLAAASVGRAAGPSIGPVQGGAGIVAGPLRFVTLPFGSTTTIVGVGRRDGQVRLWTELAGSWGVAQVAFDGTVSGLTRDGKELVLADASPYGPGPLRARSSFALFDTRTLRFLDRFTLRGDFAFDAVSPSGRVVYLVQHVSRNNLARYVVRAYDRRDRRLLARPIADRTQRGWVMEGMPMTRVASPTGRWVYTLYSNPSNVPFVHALDTVAGSAHCIGLPWPAGRDQSPLANLRLALAHGGRSLVLVRRSGGGTYAAIDTRTWRLSRPAAAGGAWRPWLAAVGAALALAAALAVLLVRSRRRAVGRRLVAPSADATA
jgi:hypothetical protein